MSRELRIVDAEFKFFDAIKGYGFITNEELGDLFVHATIYYDVFEPGQIPEKGSKFRVRVGKREKGWIVVKIYSAEMKANKETEHDVGSTV